MACNSVVAWDLRPVDRYVDENTQGNTRLVVTSILVWNVALAIQTQILQDDCWKYLRPEGSQ